MKAKRQMETTKRLKIISYILIALALFAAAQAQTTEGHGLTISKTQTWNGITGFLIEVQSGANINVTAITKTSSEAGTRFYITNETHTLLYQGVGVSGNTHTFNRSITLYEGKKYFVGVAGSTCGSRIMSNEPANYASTFPVSRTYVKWLVTAAYSNCADISSFANTTGDIYSIVSLTFTPINTTSPAPPASDNFQITAKNLYDNSAITTFSAEVDGSIYSTTNGTINSPLLVNSTELHNITVFKTDYFNDTYTNLNVSSDLEAYLFQAELRLNAYDLFTGSAISVFNATTGSLFNQSTGGTTKFYLNAGTFTFTGKTTGYPDISKEFTVSALSNTTGNLTFAKILNVTARNAVSSLTITNFTVTITGLNVSENYTKTTTNGSTEFFVREQTYNVSIDGDIYAPSSQLITTTAGLTTLTFYLYTQNSFNITFRDEGTLQKLNSTTITLDLISDIYANTYSTSNGSLYIDLLTPTTYKFRYYASGYSPRVGTYTLTENTYNEVTLYLASTGINVTLYVYDEFNNPVEDATIQVYKYSTASNSYILVNTINTDFNGAALTTLLYNSEFYRFYVYYGGVLKKSTSPAYITGTTLVFTISQAEKVLENFFQLNDITYQLVFTPSTHSFRYYFNDPNMEISRGCLRIYSLTAAAETLLNDTCVSGYSSTIVLSVANESNVYYIAKGYVTLSGKDYLLSTLTWQFQNNALTSNYGVFLVVVLLIVFAFMGFWSLEVASVLTPLPLVFGSIFGWVQIPMAHSIGILFVGIGLAVLIGRRQ
jgi:hypothetical protein